MRILVINPVLLRHHALGACEQDRLANVFDLTQLGHQVRLLTRHTQYQNLVESEQYYRQQGIDVEIVPPVKQRFAARRFKSPGLFDGAAWDYGSPDFLKTIDKILKNWKPDLVWCHATYLWPAAVYASRAGFPTVIRSVNYEPDQVLHEGGKTLLNRLRYLAKTWGERQALSNATVIAAITPDEQRIYQSMNNRATIELLPLRTLPNFLHLTPNNAQKLPLRVFFMGASYNVPHNLSALLFILNEIVPQIRAVAPGCFEFHMMGSKVPHHLLQRAASDLIFDGYVPDLDSHLAQMDIAVVPSLFGVGMQQKVFEPLCRGFATITHRRGLAGYPFEDGKHILLAENASEFVQHLVQLKDPMLRYTIGLNAHEQARQLFGRAQMDKWIDLILNKALSK
jgi:hypothetical protein